jgi:hypothetical protein
MLICRIVRHGYVPEREVMTGIGPVAVRQPRSRREPKPEFPAMPTAAKKATPSSANPTEAVSHLADVTDRMHGLLMDRADALMGCVEGSAEEAELAMLTDIIEAYERQRWPEAQDLGRQGIAAN